ncbi:MAG TPA: hydrogenase maturation nickel metallochaperone HypA [Terriglobia bacterium]|nr:hydrogenase maturation nickel metallochaperone HypA [Terriglobia bacterium]
MHELGIANSIFDAVRSEAERRPGARVSRVGVRVGELSSVDPDALKFSFEVLVKDTPFSPLPLQIELCPLRHRCPACGNAFVVVDYATVCPHCGERRTECVGGTELELSFLELEEP